MTDKELEEIENKKKEYDSKYKFDPAKRIETIKQVPSLSNYNNNLVSTPLEPMREKEVFTTKEEEQAKKLLINDSRRYGIKLDMGDNPSFNYGNYINHPGVSKKEPSNLSEAAKNINSNDPAIRAKAFLELKGNAPQEKVPELNSRQLFEDAKKQPSKKTRMQSQRDAQFQEYKDITSKNQTVKSAWDAKNRTELIDFLESQKDKGELTASEKARYDALQKELNYKNEALNQKTETDRLRIAASKYKTTNPRSTKENINLPFESENIINEMNFMTGGASEAKSKRNQQRLNDLLASQPEDKKGIIFNTLTDLSDKSSKVRTQLDKQETLRNKAKSNSLPTDEYDSKISELEAELNQYQGNIKSVLNGKMPENKPPQQKTTSPEATKQKLDDFFK